MNYTTLRSNIARWITGVLPISILWDSGTWTGGSVSVTIGGSTVSQTFSSNKNTSLAALSVKISAVTGVMGMVYDAAGSIIFLSNTGSTLVTTVSTTSMTGTLKFTVPALPVFFWMDQNAPRPVAPYIAGKISLVNSIGQDYSHRPASDGTVSMVGNREVVLMLQSFGSTAFQILLDISASLRRRTSLDLLWASGLAFIDDNDGVKDITIVLDERFESRAALDLRLRTSETISDTPGVIEHVEAIGKFMDENNVEITLDTITIS